MFESGKVRQFIGVNIMNEDKEKKFNDPTREIGEPFINEHGVIIGDNFYDSPNSPLNNWSTEIDPAIMAGDEWVHPVNDIGWNTRENQELLRTGKIPQGVPFMHPTQDVSYDNDELEVDKN
jgi:hypothetical protein